MQNKPSDTPKIIGLTIGIVLVLIIALWRIIPAMQPPAAQKPGDSSVATGQTPPIQTASATTPAVINPGQMRRFDDAMDMDAPVGAPVTFGGHGDAFRPIKAPVPIVLTARPTFRNPDNGGKGRSNAPIGGGPAPPLDPIVYVAAPPLEVTLDGVYIVGQERVAQMTIHDTSQKTGPEQTVYRREGEMIGLFKIAKMTDMGVWLRGQTRPWSVGDKEQLGQGYIPTLRTASAPVTKSDKAETLPIMPPHPH